jgi:hypothetical protein
LLGAQVWWSNGHMKTDWKDILAQILIVAWVLLSLIFDP